MKAMPLKQGEAQLFAIAQRKRDGELKLLTWKQDRSVSVARVGDAIILREQGFLNQELTFSSPSELKHELKAACDREFPRSHRVKVAQVAQ